ISSGSCSAVFASGVWSGYSPVSLSIYVPPVSNSTALTAVVPISRPTICLYIEQPPFAVIISFIICVFAAVYKNSAGGGELYYVSYQMTRLNMNTTAKPVSPMMVSMTVQDFSVSPVVMPKKRLTSQKPESLTWDSTVAPLAMEMAIRPSSGWVTGLISMIGAMRPAPVTIATVAEPCATRTNVVMTNAATTSGRPAPTTMLPMTSPTPLWISTSLNTPPAPVMRMMIPAGSSAFVATSCTSSLE